jgi:hypothetical protein
MNHQTVGKLSLSITHWHLLSYINITEFSDKYEQIGNIVKIIENSCNLGNELEMQEIQHLCNQYRYQAIQFLTEINYSKDQIIKIIK